MGRFKNLEWVHVKIYVCTTFQDMYAERKYLWNEVIPELRVWCNNHKINLSIVDLRQGANLHDVVNPNTLGKCLRKIDECRPFFICFLGQRRDWVPYFEEDINPETFAEYADLGDMAYGMSLTEIEIEHALNPFRRFIDDKFYDYPRVKHGLFFFRDDSYIDDITDYQRLIYTNDSEGIEDLIEISDEKLEETKNKIRQIKKFEDENSYYGETRANISVTDYKGEWNRQLIIPELDLHIPGNESLSHDESHGRLSNFEANGKSLKDVIIEQLKEHIILEFPDSMDCIEPETELERELEKHENFCNLYSQCYIFNPKISKLNEYVMDYDNNNLCLVSAAPGYNRTGLLSKFATDIDKKYPEKRLFKRFCGITNLSSNTYLLWKSIIDEAGIEEYEYYYPKNIHELKRNILIILDMIAAEGDCVIIIDSINHSSEGINMLQWFDKLPKDLKLIISVKEDHSDEKYDLHLKKIKNQYNVCGFEILNPNDDDLKKMVEESLDDSIKTLSDDDIEMICSVPSCRNPLYLKILLNEFPLMIIDIQSIIRMMGDSPISAFNRFLDRLEKDREYSDRVNIVPLIFSLLAVAHNGLLESELVEIICDETGLDFDESTIYVNSTLTEAMPFMAIIDGCNTFFYEAFRRAAEERYSDINAHSNELLIDYFKSQINNDKSFNSVFDEKLRAYKKLPYHLNQAERYDELHNLLSSFEFIKNKFELTDINTLIADYRFSDDHPFNYMEENHPVILIGNALELSAPVLNENKDQLSAQLWTRLYGTDNETVQNLLDEIESQTTEIWLKSHSNDQYSGQTIAKRIIPNGKKSTTALAMPDENTVIIGTEDGKLSCFDLDYGELNILDEYDSKIIKIISNNDGTILVANANGNIKKWNIRNMFIEKEYPKIDAEITDIFLSETQNKIYASSHEGIFSIDLNNDDLRKESIEAKDYNQILIQKSNNSLFVCSENEVECYDLGEMRKLYAKIYRSEYFSETVFSNDIKFIGINEKFSIFISEDGQMKFWNGTSEELIDEVQVCHLYDKFKQAKIFEDENQIITVSDKGVLRVWDFPQPRSPHFGITINEIGFKIDIQTGIKSPTTIENYNNDLVLIGNVNNEVNIIDLNKRPKDYEIKHSGLVLSVEIDGNHMITASDNGEIYTWDFDNEEFKNRYTNDFKCNSISFNREDSKLVLAGVKAEKDGRKTYKVATCTVSDDMWEANDNWSIELDPEETTNSKEIIDIAQNNSGIVFIEEDRLSLRGSETKFDKTATTLATKFDSDDSYVGFEDGSIVRYPSGDAFSEISSPVTKIKVLDNNVIAGYDNGLIEIFALDGNHLTSLKGHENAVTDINIIDNNKIASVSADSTFKIWDLENGECTYTYFLDVYATAINICGNKVVIGDVLGNVKFYNIEV